MSFIKRLFSSTAVVEDTARSAIRGLDDLVYTEQEASEKTQIGQALYAKLWEAAVPSALSRRLIACVIVGVWAFLIVMAALVWSFNELYSTFLLDVLATIVLQPMNIVVGFYFLKQIVTEYKRNKDT